MSALDSRKSLKLMVFLFAAVSCACSSQPQTTSNRVGALLPVYQGAHDTADCGGVSGWVRDQNHPADRVKVTIFDGDTQVGTTVADRLRPDLATAGVGDGTYGFRYILPAALRDGRLHQIRVKVSATQTDLTSTPRRLTCDGQATIYEGGHDKADCDSVTGWVWDKNHPESSLKLDINDGGSRLATVTADQLRGDLRDVGLGTGKYGFSYSLPATVRDGRTHSVGVRISGTDIDLANTPKSISCPPR